MQPAWAKLFFFYNVVGVSVVGRCRCIVSSLERQRGECTVPGMFGDVERNKCIAEIH